MHLLLECSFDSIIAEYRLLHELALLPSKNRVVQRNPLNLGPHLINLLYLSTSFLWWQVVAGIIRVKLNIVLRINSRCIWRHREGSQNVHNTAIRRALSPSRPCGSVTAGAHG